MKVIKELFGSKKFLALLAGLVAVLLKAFGVPIGEEALLPVLGLIATYIVGQGVADNGKEAAKVAAAVREKELAAPLPESKEG